MMSRRSAPLSVHAVAALQYLGGAVLLAIAGLLLYGAVSIDPNDPEPFEIIDDNLFAGFLLFATAGFAVAGLAALLLGLMVQRGHLWAYVVLLILNVLSVVAVLGGTATLSQQPTHLLGLVVPALSLALLNTPRARAWFHARG